MSTMSVAAQDYEAAKIAMNHALTVAPLPGLLLETVLACRSILTRPGRAAQQHRAAADYAIDAEPSGRVA
jgi:hypothetical protein